MNELLDISVNYFDKIKQNGWGKSRYYEKPDGVTREMLLQELDCMDLQSNIEYYDDNRLWWTYVYTNNFDNHNNTMFSQFGISFLPNEEPLKIPDEEPQIQTEIPNTLDIETPNDVQMIQQYPQSSQSGRKSRTNKNVSFNDSQVQMNRMSRKSKSNLYPSNINNSRKSYNIPLPPPSGNSSRKSKSSTNNNIVNMQPQLSESPKRGFYHKVKDMFKSKPKNNMSTKQRDRGNMFKWLSRSKKYNNGNRSTRRGLFARGGGDGNSDANLGSFNDIQDFDALQNEYFNNFINGIDIHSIQLIPSWRNNGNGKFFNTVVRLKNINGTMPVYVYGSSLPKMNMSGGSSNLGELQDSSNLLQFFRYFL